MIRQLDFSSDLVQARDVSALRNLLGGTLPGPKARELRGTIFLAFPDLERPETPLLFNDSIVTFLRLAHEAVPHLFYFLNPRPESGALVGFLAGASGSPGVTADGSVLIDESALTGLVGHLYATALYAEEVGDDWETTTTAFTSQLVDPSMRAIVEKSVRDLVEEG